MRQKQRGSAGVLASLLVLLGACQGGSLDVSANGAPEDPMISSDQGTLPADEDQGGRVEDQGDVRLEDMSPDAFRPGEDMGPDAGDEEMGGPEPERHPNELDPALFFTCTDRSAQSSPSRLNRINNLEWLRDIGRARVNGPASQNPLRPKQDSPYSTYVGDHAVEAELLNAYMDVVGEAAKPIVGDTSEQDYRYVTAAWMFTNRAGLGIKCFYDDMAPADTCVADFVKVLLERSVYQRPASSQELSQMVSFAKQELALEASEGNSRKETIRQIVSGAWVTSGALFDSELGLGADVGGGRHMLGPWEIAHAVGNALMARRPGATTSHPTSTNRVHNGPREGHMIDLYRAAEDGSISDRAILAELLRKHLSGVKIDANGEVTHVGGVDPDRHDITLEYKGRIDTRGEYGLPEGLREFFVEYFDYAEVDALLKTDSAKTSKYWQIQGVHHPMFGDVVRSRDSLLTGAYGEASHKEQLDDMIARLVVEDQNVFEQLLTSRTYFLPSNDGMARRLAAAQDHLSSTTDNKTTCDNYPDAQTCAQNEFAWLSSATNYILAPYDVDALVPLNDRPAHWVDLPATQRAGVLTHPAWLAAHGGNFENDASAIYRGRWIVEHLFCGHIPDTPIGVDAQLNPESNDMSARFRIAEKTEGEPQCLACHQVMNPVGYAFEVYNHAGFYRIDNHEQTSDFGRTTLPDQLQVPPELRGVSVQDAVALSELLADSPQARQCFVRHTFRYFMGRYERPEDACVLVDMEQSYDDHGGSFNEMLITLLTSDTFLYRSVTP